MAREMRIWSLDFSTAATIDQALDALGYEKTNEINEIRVTAAAATTVKDLITGATLSMATDEVKIFYGDNVTMDLQFSSASNVIVEGFHQSDL